MAIIIEKQNTIWTIIHSRPNSRNAMDPKSANELYEAFIEFDEDDSVHVAVLCGSEGYFCSGYDLNFAEDLNRQISNMEYEFRAEEKYPRGPMGPTRLNLNKPVIAAISGPAVAGGMELALWCDMRVMEESSYFGVYCRRWGIPLIDGGTVRLPKLVGEGRAMEIILTGRKVSAKEGYKIGLCEYLVEDGQSRGYAEDLAFNLSNLPQSCMKSDMKSLKEQSGLSVTDALKNEWALSKREVGKGGLTGAERFISGIGRQGKADKD